MGAPKKILLGKQQIGQQNNYLRINLTLCGRPQRVNTSWGTILFVYTHTNRLNCGQVTMGFLHSACWLVRYSVMIESSVTWHSLSPPVF